jgi:hypothetical protein
VGDTAPGVEGRGKAALREGDARDVTQMVERPRHKSTWIRAFLREVFSMPRRHVFVFLVATVVLVILEVEFTEGWHLIHILELLGVMGFMYLLWAAWRARPDGIES